MVPVENVSAEKRLDEALPEEFWEEYSLKALLGNDARTRMLQFFMVHRDWDYTLKDVARHTHTGERTLYRIAPDLTKLGIIKLSRRIGAAKLYIWNRENPINKTLDKLALEIAVQLTEQTADTS